MKAFGHLKALGSRDTHHMAELNNEDNKIVDIETEKKKYLLISSVIPGQVL